MAITQQNRRPGQVPAPRERDRRRRPGSSPRGESFYSIGGRSGRAVRPAPPVRRERERRLEEVVLTTWAALLSGHPVECPVCSGPLTAQDGCRGCGSRLS